MTMRTTITIACPMSHPCGWDCDGELTVEVTGRYRAAWGFDPPEYPEYEIVAQTCECDPLAIDSAEKFYEAVEQALDDKEARR